MDHKPQEKFAEIHDYFLQKASETVSNLFVSHTQIYNILGEKIKQDPTSFIELYQKISKTDQTDDERHYAVDKMQAFLHYLIFQHLQENDHPCANHYCISAYNLYPTKSIENPYTLDYLQSLQSTWWNSLRKQNETLRILGSSLQLPIELKIKQIIETGNDLRDITHKLQELKEVHSRLTPKSESDRLRKSLVEKNIDFEIRLAQLCFRTRRLLKASASAGRFFQSKEVIEFVNYLQNFSYSKYRYDQLISFPQNVSDNYIDLEFVNLIKNLEEVAKEYYDLCLNCRKNESYFDPQILYDPIEALKIYYYSHGPNSPENNLRIICILKSLDLGSRHSLMDTYLHYEHFVSLETAKLFSSIIEQYSSQEQYSEEREILLQLYNKFASKPKDYFLEKAAFAGHDVAQHLMALRYLEEINTKKSTPEELDILKRRAEFFLRLAAENNNPSAIYNLHAEIKKNRIKANHSEVDYSEYFTQYIANLDIDKITRKDFELLEKLSKDFDAAKMLLAYCYENGLGFEEINTEKALEIYGQLEKHPAALIRIALIKENFVFKEKYAYFFELNDTKLVDKISLLLDKIISSDKNLETRCSLFKTLKQNIDAIRENGNLSAEILTKLLNISQYCNSSTLLSTENLGRFIEENLTDRICTFGTNDILQMLERGLRKKNNHGYFLKLHELIFTPQSKGSQKENIVRKNKLRNFIYFLAFQDLSEKNNPLALHYCNLSEEGWSGESVFAEYYSIRFNQDYFCGTAPNNDEFIQILKTAGVSTLTPELIKVCNLVEARTLLTREFNLGSSILKLTDISKRYPDESFIKLLIVAEIDWLKLCIFTSKFNTSEKPELRNLLKYIANIVKKQFKDTSQYFAVKKTNLSTDDDENKLLNFLKEATDSRRKCARAKLEENEISGSNLIAINWTLEASRIICEESEKTPLLLESVTQNNPDSLFEFYQNYANYTAEKYQDLYRDEPYKSLLEKPAEYFLELAAWAGSIDAQYRFAQLCRDNIITLTGEISQEGDLQKKQEKETSLAILKKRWRFFLEIAAKNQHGEAQVDYARAIELGYDPNNHSMPDCIISNDLGLAFYYYNKSLAEDKTHPTSEENKEIAKSRVIGMLKKATSKDPKNTTEEDFLFLKAAHNHHPLLAVRYAICLYEGYQTTKDQKLAGQIFELIDQKGGDYHKLLIAIHYLSKGDQKRFISFLAKEGISSHLLSVIKDEAIALELKLTIFKQLPNPYSDQSIINVGLKILDAIKAHYQTDKLSASAIGFLEIYTDYEEENPPQSTFRDENIKPPQSRFRDEYILLIEQGLIKIDLEIIKKFSKWQTSKEKILDLIYKAGCVFEKESVRKKYIAEFQKNIKYFENDPNKIKQLQETYPPDWFVDLSAEKSQKEADIKKIVAQKALEKAEEEKARMQKQKQQEEEARLAKEAAAKAKEEATAKAAAAKENKLKLAKEEARLAKAAAAAAKKAKEEAERKAALAAKAVEEKAALAAKATQKTSTETATHKKPEDPKKIAEEHRTAMDQFLQNKKPIRSIKSLPQFVQTVLNQNLQDLHQNLRTMLSKIKGHKPTIPQSTIPQFYITGSVSYGKNSQSTPRDLDMVFILPGLNNFNNDQIEELVRKLLPFEDVKIRIFNVKEVGFTVNIDYGKWQISIYDPQQRNKQPAWTSSIDAIRTSFDADGNAQKFYDPEFYAHYHEILGKKLQNAQNDFDIGSRTKETLVQHLESVNDIERKLKQDSMQGKQLQDVLAQKRVLTKQLFSLQNDLDQKETFLKQAKAKLQNFEKERENPNFFIQELIINPNAKGFVSRSALLVTKGLADEQSLIAALQEAEAFEATPQSTDNGSRILQDLGIIVSSQTIAIKNANKIKVSEFINKHLTPDLREKFLDVLNAIINSDFRINDPKKTLITNALKDAFEQKPHQEIELPKKTSKKLAIVDPNTPNPSQQIATEARPNTNTASASFNPEGSPSATASSTATASNLTESTRGAPLKGRGARGNGTAG